MSQSDHYFTFPLAVLQAGDSPASSLEIAIGFGMLNAGKGFRKLNEDETFQDKLEEICDEKEMSKLNRPAVHSETAEILVGSSICNVSLGSYSRAHLEKVLSRLQNVSREGAFVRMKSSFLWPAVEQARAQEDPSAKWPDRGISWREFRILCAILSVKTNRAGFAFIGWETIQHRACGFTSKKSFAAADSLPDHVAPALTHKQIRTTCDALEDLGFYARFRFSSGSRGGLMAYSVRHSRDDLAKAVCDFVNFRDRAKIKANRKTDVQKCLELLERAKVGQSHGKDEGKA